MANSRNGKRSKTVVTGTVGQVDLEVPRDRDGTFEPVIVKKRQRRVSDVDEIVLSLYPKGLTTVGNRPLYAAIGVDLDGHKDILGMWALQPWSSRR